MISIILYILSLITLIFALAPVFQWGFVSVGTIILSVISFFLFLFALFKNRILKHKKQLWFKSVAVFLCICILYSGTLITIMVSKSNYNQPPANKECTLIVLGCQIIGEYPTLTLRKRLETAKNYLDNNPKANCIVSGGKGQDEIVSESYVMKKWLVEKGISADRIIEENKSTSTQENLQFSYDIAQKVNIEDNIAIVTDGFHQFRAGLFFKEITGTKAYGISSKTPPGMLPIYYARELLALQKAFIELLQ